MKTFVSIILFVNISCFTAFAQNQGKWEFGVSVGYGKDFYDRKYYIPKNEVVPGWAGNYNSNYSLGVGIFAERQLSPSLSALIHLNYFRINVPVNTLCQCNSNAWLQKENHDVGAVGAGLRWYVNPGSAIRYFVDGKVKTDWFIALIEKKDGKKQVYNNALGYNRLVPAFGGALGIKWSRFALSAEFERNIGRATRDIGQASGYTRLVKTGILRQGISIKAAYAIMKRQ